MQGQLGMAGSLDVLTLQDGDPRLVSREETLFLFLRGLTRPLRLVVGQSAVFGRNQVRLDVVDILPTDLLGSSCGHCKQAVEDPDYLVLTLCKGREGDCFHEGCFRKWFAQAEKKALQPYRFASPVGVPLVCGDPMTKLFVGGGVAEEPYEASLVKLMSFNEIKRSDDRAVKASEDHALASNGRQGGRLGINLFLCPRCTAPQEIPFLDTEEKTHCCCKCGARFKVLVKEVKP